MRFFVSVVMLVVSFILFVGHASAQEVRLCADGKRSYFNVCPEDMQSRPPVVVEPPAVEPPAKKSKVVDCNASRAPGKRLPPECPQPSVVVEEPPVKPVDCNASRAPGKRLPSECPQPVVSGKTDTESTSGIEFVSIPAGSFMMGSRNGEDDEKNVHSVSVAAFEMGKTEVTQAQWRTIMQSEPSHFAGCDACPVESVSWNDAQDFIAKLNEQRDGYKYSLPTEAQWEYAAWAGTTTEFYTGDCISTAQANYNGNYPLGSCPKGDYREKTIPVGNFNANGFGLYDMSGNVWEWTCSEYEKVYSGREKTCNNRANYSASVVVRGGSWSYSAVRLRSSYRLYNTPGGRYDDIGFRAARTR